MNKRGGTHRSLCLCLKDKGETELVGSLVELGGVKETSNGDLDALAEGLGVSDTEDTGVVDLGLDKGIAVEVELGSDLQGNGGLGSLLGSGGSLGVPDGLSTSLEIGVDAVVVRGREDLERVVGVESKGVLGGGVAGSGGEAGDVSTTDIVGDISSERETIATDNDITGEGRALEKVEVGTGVEAELLVLDTNLGVLLALRGEETSNNVQLQALGDLVLDLNLGGEEVAGGPGLSDGQTVLEVDVLGLELTVDGARLVVLVTEDVEGLKDSQFQNVMFESARIQCKERDPIDEK